MSGESVKRIPVNLTAIFNTQTEEFENVEIMPKNPTSVCVGSHTETTKTTQDEHKFLKEIIEMFISDEIFDRLDDAVVNGDVGFIKKMFTVGAGSYFKTNEGAKILLTALVSEKYEIVELLIENGVDINKTNNIGEQIVFDLIRKNHINQLKFLLKHGLNLNICSECQHRIVPLGLAAYIGKMDIVKLFVENGADVNKCNYFNQSPLHLAVAADHTEIAKYLIENNADIDLKSGCANILVAAAFRCNSKITKILLEKGAKYSEESCQFSTKHFIEKIREEIAEEKQKSKSQVINTKTNTKPNTELNTGFNNENTVVVAAEPTVVKTETLGNFSIHDKTHHIVKTTLSINGKNYPFEGNIDDIPNFIDVVSKLSQ